MKLVADPEAAAWLATRPTTQWDAGNSTKSQAKHGFYAADVESILGGAVPISCRAMRRKEKEAYDEAT